MHVEIEARLNAGSFEEAQRLLAQLGVGREHTHVSTYFATRILYQRGKLDLPGVVARLHELLKLCPEFPEAAAMLRAAELGTLRPDARSFNAATVPPALVPAAVARQSEPPPAPSGLTIEDDSDRPTEPGDVTPSSVPHIEASLKTPQAPGIPRAPLLPRFTPRENTAPSYAPPSQRSVPSPARLSHLDLELSAPAPSLVRELDTVSSPPPSSVRHPRTMSPRAVAIDLGPLDGVPSAAPGQRNTAPSPGAVPAAPAAAPTLAMIAAWLSDRDFERALAAIDHLGAERSPELSLLETRALVGLGRKAAARRSLDRLCRAPLLDPELRASVARLLLELGDLDRAEGQARRAHSEEPASLAARLTLAWALVRADAWLVSPRCATELEELLQKFVPEACELPALAHALRALMLLQRAPDAARQAADAATLLDPSLHDAWAAAAVVAKRQGRSTDAERHYQRLLELDRHAAADLAATLESLERASLAPPVSQPGAPPVSSPRSIPRPPLTAAGPSPWDDKEQRLATGDHRPALFDFEQGLARRLEAIPPRAGAAELSVAATLVARHLTQASVSRHFAPYDLSLFSIARLDAALALIYRSPGPMTELRRRVLLGLGAYCGECLRQAYAGEWIGTAADLLRLHIEGQGLCFAPLRDMHARLQGGKLLDFGDAPVTHPGAEPLGQRVALDVNPPAPWDPQPWPALSQVLAAGAHLGLSPVGLFCETIELPLDQSFASLRAIDRYVTLLAPPLAPPDPEGIWVRRAALLVGGYLGEVLRKTRGGEWETPRGELRPEAYRLVLPGGTVALPVAAAYERLSGRRLEQLSDYARRITG